MLQQIGSHQIDMLTPGELSAQLHKHLGDPFTRMLRQRYEGLKLMKIPRIIGTAPSTSPFTLYSVGGAESGPDSGYLWHIRRITVASSVASDPARYALYGGSDGTAPPNQLIDGGPQNQVVTTALTTLAVNNVPVGATTVASYNNNPFGVNVTVSGGTLTGNTLVNGTNTGATTGTFFVPAGGTITTTYSSAPTYTTAAVANDNVVATQSVLSGLAIGQAYYPATKGAWLWPNETVYAVINNPTANAVYTLSGIAVEVPFEMQGKIL